MSRDTFPRQADRDAITAFLGGWHTQADDFTETSAGADHKLRYQGETIAWFDTAGALTVKLLPGWQMHYSRAIIQEMMKQLGIDAVATQEVKELESFGKVIRTMHYFIDDKSVALGEPHVLAGSLTVAAYRASKGIPLT